MLHHLHYTVAMGLFNSLNPTTSNTAAQESENKGSRPDYSNDHKDSVYVPDRDLYNSDGESISSGQDGIKKAQATTIVWSRKSLIIAYAL